MKIPTTYRPYQSWPTEILEEEIELLDKWVQLVPVCYTEANLRKHRNLKRMKYEMKLRTA